MFSGVFAAEIAPEVDRLVWTVNHTARDVGKYRPAFEDAGIGDVEFTSLANLAPALRTGPVPERIFLRRYRYRRPDVVRELIATLLEADCLAAEDDGYAATDRLAPVLSAIEASWVATADEVWDGHEEAVATLSPLVRRILDTAPDSPLLAAYRLAPEPPSPRATLFQRLAVQRLIRNEAHAAAWKARGLSAEDMVVLTALWLGEVPAASWTGPPTFVNEGLLTEEGREVRSEIEADTNDRNELAFVVLGDEDRRTYLATVRALPGTPP